MAAVIALRPKSDHGGEILDELERRSKVPPMQDEVDDGTRRYHLDGDADVDAFDAALCSIDLGRREYVESWRSG
jgi:hypothetical protein